MRLNKLELYGFKSFAKRTEIVFPQNVTGIVGPNGSGKSNIGDAVRWVLGEQSARLLRGNSMADVIFNGTEKRKPLNFCEVILTFDNSDHKLNVAYDEVSITRRVYRSGDSEYLMNGSPCRLKDIVDLFRDTGIGKEGYSMIGQGRIDEILSQKSEDRRAVFEEAAGISRFRSRKEEAENRLKHADENLLRIVDILDELTSHMGPLKRQSDVAREYLTLSERLKELDVRLYMARYTRLHEKEAAAEQSLLAMSDLVNQALVTLNSVNTERDQVQQQEEQLQQTLNDAHHLLLEKNDLLHDAKEAFSSLQIRIQNKQETSDRIISEEKHLEDRKKLILKTIEMGSSSQQKAQELLDQAIREEEIARENVTHAETTVTEIESDLNFRKESLLASMNRQQDIRNAKTRQVTIRQQMLVRREELANSKENEKVNETAKRESVRIAEEKLNAAKARLDEIQADTTALEAKSSSLLQEILKLQKEVQDDLQTAKVLETRLKTLRELQDGFDGYQYAVKNALSHAKRNNIRGVHNAVAMLLNVPEQYETAIDMALGGAMQNIVTDTEYEAKLLIDYLRNNRLGRATFLPLSTVHGRTLNYQERQVLSMEGCIGIASELISFDPKYQGIIDSLLGRTVIAQDLDHGIEIMKAGKQAFKLVTLKGEVMHTGGSITGGSIQQKAQNLLGREREMKDLADKLAALSSQTEKKKQQILLLEQKRSSIKTQRDQAINDLHQQDIAVARDTDHLGQAREDLEDLIQTIQDYEESLQQLDETINDIDAELERLSKLDTQEKDDPEELNQKIAHLTIQLEKARNTWNSLRDELTGAMLSVQSARHDYETQSKDMSRLGKDLEICETEIASLYEQHQSIARELRECESSVASAEVTITRCETEVSEAKSAVDRTDNLLEEKRLRLKNLQKDADTAQQIHIHETEKQHRQEIILGRIKNDITQLNDRLWNSYELSFAGAEEAFKAYEDAHEGASFPFVESEAEQESQRIRDRIRAMGTVNVGAIEEYSQLYQRFTQLSSQKEDLEKAKQDLQALITQLLDQMKTVFVGQFGTLQEYFSETFTRLFGGGSGEIRLADDKDPLNCGIDIIVQPPGKKRQLLSLFSGGERALTAIAILFAMLKLKPTPFCILDEIEAALDDANISYFADYLKEFGSNTQFIVVTHRKGTMERCDSLFGVAMEERGISSMVSVNLTDYIEKEE